ncbi:MAG: type II secretion system F family protein [Candidatus Doudnabacteria bacterium]
MRFVYQARNLQGELKRGYVVASNPEKAEQLLSDNGLVIISIREQGESLTVQLERLVNRVSYKDLVIFSRQLSTMAAARVPILQALRILESQTINQSLVAIIRDLIAAVEGGQSLSLALSKHPNVFGNVYVSLVKSGEAAGTVADSLSYLADQLEKDYDLRARVKSALTYPVFVLGALVIVGVLMFKFVLPSLIGVLKEQQAELPALSKGLIVFTDFFQVYWWVIILIFIGTIIAARGYALTVAGKYQWDIIKIKFPLIGQLMQKIYMARFSRNLSTLVSGGIPIIQAIKIVAEVVNNQVYRDILLATAEDVTNGKSISESLSPYPEFPAMVTQMVRVGEQTAELDTILLKLAIFYEKEVDSQISTISSLLEPIIMIVLGVGVGLLVAGVLMPIYNLANAV